MHISQTYDCILNLIDPLQSSAIAKLASAYDKTLRDKNKDPEEYIKHILR